MDRKKSIDQQLYEARCAAMHKAPKEGDCFSLEKANRQLQRQRDGELQPQRPAGRTPSASRL